jgi:acyl-CoA thioesterase
MGLSASDIIQNDMVARSLGMELVSASEGRARVAMDIDGRHMNAAGTVHGGAIFSLADVAFAIACNSRGLAVAANASINYCAAARAGRLTAEARELSLSNRLGSYAVEVTDGDGKLIACMQCLAYRLPEKPKA